MPMFVKSTKHVAQYSLILGEFGIQFGKFQFKNSNNVVNLAQNTIYNLF